MDLIPKVWMMASSMEELRDQIITIIVVVNGTVILWISGRYAWLWLIGRRLDREFTLRRIISMRRIGVDPVVMIRARRRAISGLHNVSVKQIEAHYRKGGNPLRVIRAIELSQESGTLMGWEGACRVDLSGGDLEEAARTGMDPSTGQTLTH